MAIVPPPRGGDWLEDEAFAIKRSGIDVRVSMLTRAEAEELVLAAEKAACEKVGVLFHSFPIHDRQVPLDTYRIREFVGVLQTQLHSGKSIAVHCRASIGRSSLLLACVLCAEGLTPQDAFRRISKARGMQVPDTPEQVRWVEDFASKDFG